MPTQLSLKDRQFIFQMCLRFVVTVLLLCIAVWLLWQKDENGTQKVATTILGGVLGYWLK